MKGLVENTFISAIGSDMANVKTAVLFAALCFAGLLATQNCQAQEQKTRQTGPVFYVGLAAMRASYEVLYPSTPSLNSTGPWQVSIGARLTQRLSVELGYTSISHHSREDPAYTGTTLSGNYISGKRGSDSYTLAVPLLLRYTAIKRPHPRLQVDALVGMTLIEAKYNLFYVDYIDGIIVRDYHASDHANQLFITVGLGARYPFGRHLEGVLDWTYSHNLKAVSELVHQQVTGNRFGLTRALSLGLRYRFALKKQVAAGS